MRGRDLFDASVYKHPDSTRAFHDMVRNLADLSAKAKPTPFHYMLASIAGEGRLLRLYSQNVDGLETSMQPLTTTTPLNKKGPWPRTIQLHGSLEKMYCTKCGEVRDLNPSIFVGTETPDCPACTEVDHVRVGIAGKRSHGIGRMRPRMVLYNEHHPDEDAIGAVSLSDIKASPDAVIVVGTTLKVPGARRIVKQLCVKARGKRNGLTVWINSDSQPPPPEFKDCFDILVEGKADDVATIVNLPYWDDDQTSEYTNVADLPAEQRKLEERKLGFDRVEVQLPMSQAEHRETVEMKTNTQAASGPSMITPGASPGITPGITPGKSIKKHQKPKQAKLSFSSKDGMAESPPEAQVGREGAASKHKPRKPRRPKNQSKRPAVDISRSFKTTKSIASASKGTKELEKGFWGGNTATLDTSALPPLRPSRPKPPPSALVEPSRDETLDVGPTGSKKPLHSSASNTASSEKSVSLDIISPEAVPRGVADLG